MRALNDAPPDLMLGFHDLAGAVQQGFGFLETAGVGGRRRGGGITFDQAAETSLILGIETVMPVMLVEKGPSSGKSQQARSKRAQHMLKTIRIEPPLGCCDVALRCQEPHRRCGARKTIQDGEPGGQKSGGEHDRNGEGRVTQPA